LKNKFLYILTASVFFLTACDQVSEEALNAGFKSNKEYSLHIEKVRIKRDKNFKEAILYVSNLQAFDLDSEYTMAAKKLKKEQKKYISSGGEAFRLLIASENLLSLQAEVESVNSSQKISRQEAIRCMVDLDEPSGAGYIYELEKALYDSQVLMCGLKMIGGESISSIFLNAHTAARQLVNSEQVFDSKDAAKSHYQILLQKLNNEQKNTQTAE